MQIDYSIVADNEQMRMSVLLYESKCSVTDRNECVAYVCIYGT